MNRGALLGIGLLILVVFSPVAIAVVAVALVIPPPPCPADPAVTTPVITNAAPGDAAGDGLEVTVAHANIKTTLSASDFAHDLDTVIEARPDLVSLNEVDDRPDRALRPSGYAVWREPDPAVRGADGTAVLWREDRWELVARGRVVLVDHGPQRWDRDRAATWVTLRSTGTGAVASMVSVHQMINPGRYGPDRPLRRRLYRTGMQRLVALVRTLDAAGPVVVGGDFNSQFGDDDPWGPRRTFAEAALTSTMEGTGPVPTHDGGGTIDYLFYPPARTVLVEQRVRPLISDHHLLTATLRLDNAASPNTEAGVAGQVPAPLTAASTGLSPIQLAHAATVVDVGRRRGVSDEGIVIALAVVSQESGFRVYANDGLGDDLAPDQAGVERSMGLAHDAVGSDHGSVGLFQQQWPWWGTLEELMEPDTSATLFYDALLAVPQWPRLTPGTAAQAVQRSDFPNAYDDDVDLARALLRGDLSDPTAIARATSEAGCTTTVVTTTQLAGTGTVVPPVASDLGSVGADLHNWGGTGALWHRWHTGTDFSVPCGTPVLASHAGTVVVETDEPWAGPWLVKVSTGPGRLTTWYAHLQRLTTTAGTRVAPGDVLGEVGAAGNATGCHLHFEVHTRGGSIYGPDNVDPSVWLADHRDRGLNPDSAPATGRPARTGTDTRTGSGRRRTAGHQRGRNLRPGGPHAT